MPIYEYECSDCGHHIEVIQKVDARAPGRCAECSGKLRKKISRTSFQLKGGGWYTDGYGKATAGSSGSEGASKPGKDKTAAKSDKTKKAASA